VGDRSHSMAVRTMLWIVQRHAGGKLSGACGFWTLGRGPPRLLDRRWAGIYDEIGLLDRSFRPPRLSAGGLVGIRRPSSIHFSRQRHLQGTKSVYIQIGLLILVLAAFVIAFFSARTWHWGYVLVVLGILLSTLGFFLLTAETLRINAVLRSQVNDLEEDLAGFRAQNVALEKGSEDPTLLAELRNQEVRIPEDAESIRSLANLEHQLRLKTRERGRVWWNVTPVGLDAQTGAVQIGIERPVPAGVQPESVVVLFEVGEPQSPAADGQPRGAQYLGEFRVTEATGQTATLQPVLPLDDYERQRLANSRGPWIMYDTMPADRHKVFAGMSEEELRQKLPPQSVEEYLRHGQPPGPDDDPLRVAGFDESGKRLPPDQLDQAAKKVYQRRLRDYALEFDELARERVMLAVNIAAAQQDRERLQTALAAAKELQAFREDEIQKLNTDLAGVTKERQAIESHLAQVQRQLARGRQLLAEALRRNSQLADELSASQTGSSGAASPASPPGPLALGRAN